MDSDSVFPLSWCAAGPGLPPGPLEVRTPARLHFGLWSLAGPPSCPPAVPSRPATARQFGGAGAMVVHPRVRLRIEPAEVLDIRGPQAPRVQSYVASWAAYHGRPLPACRITVQEAIPPHTGLGSGTQLGLAVAAGLSALFQVAVPSLGQLAASVGRAQRSAVGTYGFALGGLIVEQGKQPGEGLSPLAYRIELPSAWRFVLVRPLGVEGWAGSPEREAFERLPPVPPEITEALMARVRQELVPAALREDFETFAEGLYAYGRQAGMCFAPLQGGPFNGPVVTELVERLRRLGVRGVGQSSWGPTVFAVLPDPDQAQALAARLRTHAEFLPLEVLVTEPAAQGACIRALPPDEA